MEPLIVTLTLNAEAQAYFDRLRQAHFPSQRNYLKAHLTLFHHLPPTEAHIPAQLAAVALATPPLPLQVAAVAGMGNGVAFKIECPPLARLHAGLQQQWPPWLTAQDRQKLWPHVTVQNKVAPAVARTLQEELAAGFVPFEATGTGFGLWAYAGGPWRWLQHFPFAGVPEAAA